MLFDEKLCDGPWAVTSNIEYDNDNTIIDDMMLTEE